MRMLRNCRHTSRFLLAVGAAIAATSAAYAQPANDLCTAAQVVTEGSSTPGDNTGASGADITSCTFGDTLDVWFSFTPAAAGIYQIDTLGSALDTSVSVFDVCDGTELACNDDSGSLQSAVQVTLSAGVTVYIRVAGYAGGSGPFTLNVSNTITPMGNDDCSGAVAVSPGSATPGNNLSASGSDITSCAGGDTQDVWYVLTTTTAGLYQIDTLGSAMDTSLAVYDACGGTELACNDDSGGLQSSVSVSLGAAVQTYIRVAGYGGATGTFTLNVSNPIQPSVNDECTSAIAVTPGSSTSGDNLGASGTDVSSCTFGDTQDVWYVLTTTGAGLYQIDTFGSTLDTSLAVYDACGGTELACNDQSGGGAQSSVVASLGAGVQAYIRVAGYNGATGAFTLNVSNPMMPAANDECTGAVPVTPGSSTAGDNLTASGTDITSCAGGDTQDVWFVLNTTTAGFYQIDTFGSGLDTSLAVYNACGGPELACNDDSGGLQSMVNVQLPAASQAFIRVAGYNGATGAFTLNVGNPVVPPPPPANDDCAAATVIPGLPFADSTTDISGATDDADLASCNNAGAVVTPQGVWYTFTPAVTDGFRVRLNGTLATFASVFTGTCGGGFTEVTGACGRNFVVSGTAGTQYTILVGASGTAGLPPLALINLTVEAATPPANDDCGSAVAVTPGTATFGDNTNSTGTDLTTCGFQDATDVWYSLAISTAGTYIIDSEGSTGLTDTVLSVFDTCGGTELGCDDDAGTGFLSRLEIVLNPGTYLVRVAGYNGAQGAFQLNVSDNILPPSNDTCGGAAAITSVPSSISATSLGATSDLASSSCAFTPTDDRDVWFSFTPAATDFYVFDTSNSIGLTDTTISVFDACFGTEIGCDDDSGTGLLSRLNISLNAGTTYFIRIAGWNHTSGDFVLDVSVGGPPAAGDNCENPVVVTSPSSTTGDTTNFTSQLAASSCGFLDNIDAWFSFTPTSSATYTIDTLGSDLLGMDDTTLSVFDACGGNEIACNEDIDLEGGNWLSSVDVSLNAGTTYFIRVAGYGGATGGFQLNIAGGASSDGACCAGSTCSIGTAATCTGANTSFAGVGTVCNVFGTNNTTPCCLADYNHSGAVTVQDIFDFLGGYFNVNLQADINASGAVTVQDIFDFLSAYFTGC